MSASPSSAGEDMVRPVPLTDVAISRIRRLIQSGRLPPGSRLPPEPQLAAQLGVSRNPLREAVKALVVARVLDVRRGDGTYVTSLEPRLLLQGVGLAVELLRADSLREVVEVRRLLEPVATALAATRVSPARLAEIRGHLEAMRAARDDVEKLTHIDAAFHRAVVAATGNETLTTLLEGIAGRTLRLRTWRGLVEADAVHTTLAEHEAIYDALEARDPTLAQATALMHLNASETWLRTALSEAGTGGLDGTDDELDDLDPRDHPIDSKE
ncbi:FadR/GntR family transcriptional regulator [Actinomadura sp. HBU206391]|uniref:FadR/GntR family transcriptional regulator n=1 Tax=Actinomadura sp. HBU206391 TaxID=2731692 RepID=UPI001C9CE694|nr:FadR/GntR family transcriptional regulator [Actinomadura sp. HBU206391]